MTSTRYRTVTIDGLNVFYREAGTPDAPADSLSYTFVDKPCFA
jgi:hypothetical protein